MLNKTLLDIATQDLKVKAHHVRISGLLPHLDILADNLITFPC